MFNLVGISKLKKTIANVILFELVKDFSNSGVLECSFYCVKWVEIGEYLRKKRSILHIGGLGGYIMLWQ